MAYNSAYKGSEIDAAVGAVKTKEKTWDDKMPAVTGTPGQMVGFDPSGNPVAQDVPATGLTEEAADKKYLKLTGGVVDGATMIRCENPKTRDIFHVDIMDDRATIGATNSIGSFVQVERDNVRIVALDHITIDADRGHSITFGSPISIQPGTDDTHAATVAQAIPKVTLVTLSASGWDSSAKTQTVTVSGIDADESKQWIMPTPAAGHKTAYDNAGIQCTAQAADAVTFTASTVPTADIKVWVKVENVNDVTPA